MQLKDFQNTKRFKKYEEQRISDVTFAGDEITVRLYQDVVTYEVYQVSEARGVYRKTHRDDQEPAPRFGTWLPLTPD
jgi:ribosomal 50S subunit-recycling heat shock protein